MNENQRHAGVLMHISTLHGEYSCGGFGQECYDFVDFLAKSGFTVWQTLPFCMPDEHHSPYSSYSAFSLNYLFISLEALKEDGLLTESELKEAKQIVPYTCEFKRLDEERFALLEKAASRVQDKTPIYSFLQSHPYIESFCLFMAKKQENQNQPWTQWSRENFDQKVYETWAFTQYTFLKQWNKVRDYAHQKGISVIGDVPIYLAYDSAEVWSHPEWFDLDENKKQKTAAGCPPDYFSEEGQFWGNPIYRWDEMKKDGFRFWRDRMAFMFELFDGVRLDHFRGFSSYWSISATAKTAKEGKWKKGPGRAFVRAMKEVAEGRLIIAEDLGEATPDVKELLDYSGFPGMRVFQFGFEGESNSSHLPHQYISNTVAYTGTHDNDTLLGYIFGANDGARQRLLAYIGEEGKTWEQACRTVVRQLYASVADRVIFPIQDLLCFGNDTRMNTPGLAAGNWGFRITKEQLFSLDTSHFYKLSDLYGRLPCEKHRVFDTRFPR